MSLASKIAVSNFVYGLPMLVLVALLLQGKNDDINTARQELRGNAYQRPIERLLELVSKHRILGQRESATPGPDWAPKRQALEAEIDRAWLELSTQTELLGEALLFTDGELASRGRSSFRAERIRAEWEAFSRERGALPPAALGARYDRLLNDLRGMVRHLGDTSKLILDPDLDTYYLMDVTLNALPKLQARVVETMIFVEPLSGRQTLTEHERIQVELLRTLLWKEDLAHIVSAGETAVREDGQFRGHSPSLAREVLPLLAKLSQSTRSFDQVLHSILEGGPGSPTREQLALHGDTLLDDTFAVWPVATGELDRLLELRIAWLEAERARGLLFSFAALILAASVSSYLGWSIADTAKRQFETSVRQLTEAKLAADAANVAKSAFLANMSHEIRTPMNGVIAMSNLLRESNLSPDHQRLVEVICSSGQALNALINDILDSSKIEAGKLDLEHLPFDVSRLVSDLAVVFSLEASKRGLHFNCDIDRDVPKTFKGDPNRLRQILTNLCGNALKLTSVGGVSVRVSLDAQDADAATLRFTVRDTGPGISPGKQALLFQPFVQLDASISRRFGGTGLGLSISRQLAELMGGRIGVESEEGHGAAFWFTVRLVESAPVVAAPSIPKRSPGEAEGAPPHERFSLLVAEDNQTNQTVLREILRRVGLEARFVETGRDALSALLSESFDLVFMDVQIPLLDGLETTRTFRRLSAGAQRRVPIVAMTANALKGDREACLDAGMDDYVSKPIDVRLLIEVLSRWLKTDFVFSRPVAGRLASTPPASAPSPSAPSPSAAPPNHDDASATPNAALELRGPVPIFDAQALLDRMEGDRALAMKVASGFLHDMPARVADFIDLIRAGCSPEALVVIHGIKGAAANVSGERLAALSQELATAVASGNRAGAQALSAEVEPQFRALQVELERWLQAGGDGSALEFD